MPDEKTPYFVTKLEGEIRQLREKMQAMTALSQELRDARNEFKNTRDTVTILNRILQNPDNPRSGMLIEVTNLRSDMTNVQKDIGEIQEGQKWWARNLLWMVVTAIGTAASALIGLIWTNSHKGP